MKRHYPLLLVLLFMVLTVGCTHHSDSRFSSAEALMETHPDSMLNMLKNVNYDSLPTDRDRALHGVMLGLAYVANFRTTEDDSLIHKSLNFYREHGPDSMLLHSLYLSGLADVQHQRSKNAIKKGEEGLKIAKDRNNLYWMGRFCSLISDAFEMSYNPTDALDYAIRSASYYKRAGRKINYYDMLWCMQKFYTWLGDYNRGEELLDSMLALDDVKNDHRIWLNCMNSRFYHQAYTGNYEEAKVTADTILKYSHKDELNTYQLCYMAMIAGHEKQYSDMKRYLDMGADRTRYSSDTLTLIDGWLEYYRGIRDTASLVKTYENCIPILNKIQLNSLKQSGVTEQRNMARIDLLETEKRHTREMTLLGAVLGVLAAGALMMWMYMSHKVRVSRMETEEKMGALFDMRDKYENLTLRLGEAERNAAGRNDTGTDFAETAFRKALKRRWEAVNHLCSSYVESRGTATPALLKNIRMEFERMRQPSFLKELENLLDMGYGGLMKEFRADFSDILDKTDIALAICLFSGIPITVTVYIIGESRSQIYRRREAMKSKLAASEKLAKPIYANHLTAI